MGEGSRDLRRGIRPADVVLAGALTGLGVLQMLENIRLGDASVARSVADGSMAHAMTAHTWWMLPVWVGATLPFLWWRRSPLVVGGVVLAVLVVHDLAFGWVGRCGAGLPLGFVVVFLGAIGYERRRAWAAFGVGALVSAAVLVRDSIAGPDVLLLVAPGMVIVLAVGRAVRHRTAMGHELRARTDELRTLRDERAALVVADDRARLSRQLDGLLQDRLEELTRAAESASGLDPAASRALLEDIEADSRATLDDMREIVGLLRGGDVALAPTPTVAHLDALLARRAGAEARLRVAGDPRTLPATVELSTYRIVEHLLDALAEDAHAGVEVSLRFEDTAVEIRVVGPVSRGAAVRAAVARARERANLLGGSVEVRVARGRATAVAQLPVPG